MRTWPAFVALGLLLTGCPKAETPAPVKAAEQAAIQGPSEGKRTKPLFRDPGGKRSDALCDQLACTDEQRDSITQILADSMPDRSGRARRGHADGDAANAALAAAFSAADFSTAALEAFHAAGAANVAEARTERQQAIAKAIVDMHAALEPDQRSTLADVVAKDGIAMFMGRVRGSGSGTADPPDQERRAKRMATRLCHRVTCATDQEDRLAATLVKLPAGTEPDPEPARAALATALRSDSVDAAAVTAYFAASEQAEGASAKVRDAAWVELHAGLTAEQRKLLAESIAEEGMQALHGSRARKGGGPRVRRK